jgi:hypothetical protein
MPPICFIDGAGFSDTDGFLQALNQAVLAVPSVEEAWELLAYLRRGSAAAGSRGRPRLHLVWLNSDVSRRRSRVSGLSFGTLTYWLVAFRDIDLILL